jgi:hypothetical protein
VSGQLHAQAALSPGKEQPLPIGKDAGWASVAVWTIWRREHSWFQRDSNSDPSTVQSVASRYTDCAIPVYRTSTECLIISWSVKFAEDIKSGPENSVLWRHKYLVCRFIQVSVWDKQSYVKSKVFLILHTIKQIRHNETICYSLLSLPFTTYFGLNRPSSGVLPCQNYYTLLNVTHSLHMCFNVT